jgi:parvulin-like peptidyl-prolyl isomerase
MLNWIREKFGAVVIGGIILLIAFVFIFSGIFNPKATRGLHEGAVAGTVNGESVSIAEFNRELNRRLEFFKGLAGGTLTEEQIQAFNVKPGVFRELAQKKIMIQEAKRQGVGASDEEVRDQIRTIPSFQKDGRFDLPTYRQLLEANRYTPGSFEAAVREDLSAAHWQNYFRNRVHVTDLEARQEFESQGNKRNIKFVLLTTESAKKGVTVEPAEIQAYLKDSVKLNLVKAQYELRKGTEFKGKTLEQSQTQIARELLAGDRLPQVTQLNDKLAGEVAAILSADAGSDARINALLKPYGVTVKTTGMIAQSSGSVPGVGDARELLRDAFAKTSPIATKAKKYSVAGGVVVAVVAGSQQPELAKFESEREKLLAQIESRRERELFGAWLDGLMNKAKIDLNPSVVGNATDKG